MALAAVLHQSAVLVGAGEIVEGHAYANRTISGRRGTGEETKPPRRKARSAEQNEFNGVRAGVSPLRGN